VYFFCQKFYNYEGDDIELTDGLKRGMEAEGEAAD
jgi:hypothetical protein